MPRTKKVKTNRKTEKLRAEAQEFHPTLVTAEQPLEFQDFPIPSDDYVEYFNTSYLASETGTGDEFERKPQRECDKLEGLDLSTFVVFSNVKNIPLEFNIAESDDCPARLRLCTFGSACLRLSIDCPYTHIVNDEGNWDYQDENVPSPREEMEVKVSPKFRSTTPPTNLSHFPTSISFVSTASVSSSIASSPLADDSNDSNDSNDSSDHSSISPPDSPSRSSSDSSTESDTKRQEKLVEKLKSAKVVNFTVPKPTPTTTKPLKKTGKTPNLKVSKGTKGTKSRPMSIKTK